MRILNSNVLIVLAVIFTLLLLGGVWYLFLITYLRKDNKTKGREQVLSMFKIDKKLDIYSVLCPAELPNTDEDVADALIYIKATNFAGDLLEKLYEQAGI